MQNHSPSTIVQICLTVIIFYLPNLIMSQSFIQVSGHKFILNNQPYDYIGLNYWYGAYLGSSLIPGGRERLMAELDFLQNLDIKNLRVMVESNGPAKEPLRVVPVLQETVGVFNEEMLIGLDFLLLELSKRNMHAVLVLTNYWHWTGGMAQYVSWATNKPIPYPNEQNKLSWAKYMRYTAEFYSNRQCGVWYKEFIQKIILRTNTLTGKAYTEDPTIMSWQLANEPRGFGNKKNYLKWIKEMAKFIRVLDPNHLISIGSEGITSSKLVGNAFEKIHDDRNIDYCTAHVWIQNWGWYNPKNPNSLSIALSKAKSYLNQHIQIAKSLNKPLVLEEFGVARDEGSFDPQSSTKQRSLYFEGIFVEWLRSLKNDDALRGLNLWAWSGSGKPMHYGQEWLPGYSFTGDPPHEPQGWYSIYESDTATISAINKYINLGKN